MKKKLESDLISIAHRILKLKGKEDVNKLHTEVSALYEKLTVLKFAQENFEDEIQYFSPNIQRSMQAIYKGEQNRYTVTTIKRISHAIKIKTIFRIHSRTSSYCTRY